MMKSMVAMTAAVLVLTTGAVSAQVQKETVSARHGVVKTTEILKCGKHLEQITCRSFNALDESFKPEAIGYAVDYTKKGKIKDPMIDVAGIERVTPMIITDCKARPDDPLLARVKAAFHHRR